MQVKWIKLDLIIAQYFYFRVSIDQVGMHLPEPPLDQYQSKGSNSIERNFDQASESTGSQAVSHTWTDADYLRKESHSFQRRLHIVVSAAHTALLSAVLVPHCKQALLVRALCLPPHCLQYQQHWKLRLQQLIFLVPLQIICYGVFICNNRTFAILMKRETRQRTFSQF